MSNPDLIRTLAICITARVSGEENKIVDLVQHTPKCDKGPLGPPEKIKLMPSPPGVLGPYSEPAALSTGSQLSNDYDPSYQASSQNSHQNPTLANFDRIQFKYVTAGNGKRREAQQYFHIVVELFAEIPTSQSSEGQWVKVASKTSARMVVRGSSRYRILDDRRSSSVSMGPGGGSDGDSVGGQHEANAGGPPSGSRGGLRNLSHPNSSRLGSSTHISSHAIQHHYPSSESRSSVSLRINRPDCSMLSPEDESAIQEHDGYQYFPAPLLKKAQNTQGEPSTSTSAIQYSYNSSELDASDIKTNYCDSTSITTVPFESFVTEFVDDLLRIVQSEKANSHPTERLFKALPQLLQSFAFMVGHRATSREQLEVMVFVNKYRM